MDWEVLREWEREDKERYNQEITRNRQKLLIVFKNIIKYKLMNLNKCFLLGRTTGDVESKVTPTGQKVATFNMATNRYYKDAQGNKKEEVQFHRIIAWTGLAEVCSSYLKKGEIVLIVGRIQNRSWEAKDGSKRSVTEIVAEDVQLAPKPKVAQPQTEDEEIPIIEDGQDLDLSSINF